MYKIWYVVVNCFSCIINLLLLLFKLGQKRKPLNNQRFLELHTVDRSILNLNLYGLVRAEQMRGKKLVTCVSTSILPEARMRKVTARVLVKAPSWHWSGETGGAWKLLSRDTSTRTWDAVKHIMLLIFCPWLDFSSAQFVLRVIVEQTAFNVF